MCLLSRVKQAAAVIVNGADSPSPSDIVPRESIISDGSGVYIDLSRGLPVPFTKPPLVYIPSVPDTNSMDPLMDEGHNNLLVAGQDEEEHHILLEWLERQPPGNVVVYRRWDGCLVIHRIVEKLCDHKGVGYRLKGDNLSRKDAQLVRSHQILYLSIGTIY